MYTCYIYRDKYGYNVLAARQVKQVVRGQGLRGYYPITRL